MRKTILQHALKNALDFGGSINSKVVLGLTLRDKPELKTDIPAIVREIENVIHEIKSYSQTKMKAELTKIAPELRKEKKEPTIEGPLKPLPNAIKGKVILRMAPSPSGPLHIGHAYGASLNYEYAKMYGGKFIVRIEDTNPENIYEPAYKFIENDAQWLTENHVDTVFIQSSRLGKYYDAAEQLVQKGKAYVCTCNVDTWRTMKTQNERCPCRPLNAKEQQTRYAKMFGEYAEGEAVLRLKTDINDKNPAMRDFSIMRINEHVHPKTGTKNRVWPMMVLAVAVDDHEMSVTHVLNGKEHADNAKKEAIIMNYLGWQPPEYKHWGRINFEGFRVSASKTRLAIEQKKYTGWDDIRIPFLLALRRRGYQAGAFRRYALEIGLSLNDKTVPIEEFWKNVNAFNKEIVESKANRYFFVDNPVEISLKDAPVRTVELDFHPDFPKRGKRKLKVEKEIHISKNDYTKLGEGKVHRFMDYCNFEIVKKKFVFVSEPYDDFKSAKNKGMIIHWVPVGEEIDVDVLLEDGKFVRGIGEKTMKQLNSGDIVQLERRYFARVDTKEKNKIILWYLHK
ncbi:glutamate--tRNA ligase [Candidatus Woesearchaeota archaeon CG10_big_fil_rev_8_21_14_0_10_36_11]|nr:MAG: glutamate--tRNA ligase [Candidatus Woesearchaeota archaeon CG10_big_fil_rev_8_21_14_0_10_36_11]